MLGRIAVHLNHDPACERRIDAAILLAKKHNAEIIGVYAQEDLVNRYQNAIPRDILSSLREEHNTHTENTRKLFEEKINATQVKAQWREPKGNIEEGLALQARYCDLLIMSKMPAEASSRNIMPHLPESVIMAAGRPVLMIPNSGNIKTIGERILFCWNQRREAARAFTDGAPFLRSCKSLSILEVDRDDNYLEQNDIHKSDISDYCKSLNYPEPDVLSRGSGNLGVGNIILNIASDLSSDLVIMGAYGHSRMRQWIMSGASRTILSSMTVPVLLSQ